MQPKYSRAAGRPNLRSCVMETVRIKQRIKSPISCTQKNSGQRHDRFRKCVQFPLLLVGGPGRVPAAGCPCRSQGFDKSCAESRFHPKAVLSIGQELGISGQHPCSCCCKPLSTIRLQNCHFLREEAALAMALGQGVRERGEGSCPRY